MKTPPKSLEEAFGVDGEKAIEVARMIVADRRREVRREELKEKRSRAVVV